jgi:hypothetical protein
MSSKEATVWLNRCNVQEFTGRDWTNKVRENKMEILTQASRCLSCILTGDLPNKILEYYRYVLCRIILVCYTHVKPSLFAERSQQESSGWVETNYT